MDKSTPAGDLDRPPAHYAGNGMQVFDIIRAFSLNYFEGNVLKYLLRWRKKNGLDDLYKARHYLAELIADAEKEHAL